MDVGASSRLLSKAVMTCMTSKVASERRQASDALRSEYLRLFEQVDGDGDPVWKRALQATGRLILEQLLQVRGGGGVATGVAETEGILIGFGDRLFEIPPGQEVVLLGSRPECDIKLFYGSCSRLHAIVYLFPRLNKLFIVDVGSLTGIRTVSRGSSQETLVTSNINDRQIIECGMQETMVLQLGAAMVTLNVRACVVCMEKPRACIYTECGHFLVCKRCAVTAGNVCPYCRASVDALAAAKRDDHACASLAIARAGQ